MCVHNNDIVNGLLSFPPQRACVDLISSLAITTCYPIIDKFLSFELLQFIKPISLPHNRRNFDLPRRLGTVQYPARQMLRLSFGWFSLVIVGRYAIAQSPGPKRSLA